jgi:hypothetical protein
MVRPSFHPRTRQWTPRPATFLSLLYAADIACGATEPIPLAVHSNTPFYVVAAGQQTLGETAVILDVKSWKAIVSFTGQGVVGIRGSSFLVQCH